MSISFRKVIAACLLIVLVWPLLFGSLTLLSINSRVLDRNFYVNLLDDPRLYEAMVSQDLPLYMNTRWFPGTIDSAPPPAALDKALREVMPPAYLHDQTIRIVNQAFDALDGQRDALDLDLDVAPVKASLQGEGGARFASVLAQQLPACMAGQEPLAAGSALIRCRAANMSVEDATSQISAALPQFVGQLPDQIRLSREPLNLQNDLRPFNLMFLGTAGLTIAIGLMLMIAAGSWLVTAFIGGSNRRERLAWLGWSLMLPAVLILLSGIVLSTPLITASVGLGLDRARFAIEGVQYSEALRQALIEVTGKALSAVSGGFLSTGVASAAIALGLSVWAAVTRSEPRTAPAAAPAPAASGQKTA
jgi:hypothetical protein